MKVKVKFRDTEFGLFEPSFTVPVLGTAERFRGIYLDFVANGVPWSQLVLDEAMPRDRILDETWGESPFFASPNDGVYWIIERILDSERECCEEIEIEYEGEEMNEKTITVPAGTDKVTLNIAHGGEGVTLRQLLLATNDAVPVRIVVREAFRRPSDNCHAEFVWTVDLPSMQRNARVETFANAMLCDTGVLLDERKVTIGFAGVPTFTVEANPD